MHSFSSLCVAWADDENALEQEQLLYIEILCAYPILDFLCSYQSVNQPRPLYACNS